VNRVWRVGAGGRVYKSPAYVAWAREAGWELVRQKPDRFPPGAQVAVTLRLGKAKRARDADNCAKGILDLLQAHGIVKNDRDVVDLRITWDATIEAGRVAIEVRAIERSAA
jgi:Holliday junction resolvase RusA-like endonuclease